MFKISRTKTKPRHSVETKATLLTKEVTDPFCRTFIAKYLRNPRKFKPVIHSQCELDTFCLATSSTKLLTLYQKKSLKLESWAANNNISLILKVK